MGQTTFMYFSIHFFFKLNRMCDGQVRYCEDLPMNDFDLNMLDDLDPRRKNSQLNTEKGNKPLTYYKCYQKTEMEIHLPRTLDERGQDSTSDF